MTTLVDVKRFLISRMKSDTAIVAALPIARKDDIREIEWQGTDFGYPNIRVHVESFERHTPGVECKLFDVAANILVFAEDASSLKADTIASVIWDALDTKTIGSNSIKLLNIKAKHFGAMWVSEAGLWRSEIVLGFQAS